MKKPPEKVTVSRRKKQVPTKIQRYENNKQRRDKAAEKRSFQQSYIKRSMPVQKYTRRVKKTDIKKSIEVNSYKRRMRKDER